LGQKPLILRRENPEKALTDYEAQDGIAQEFEALKVQRALFPPGDAKRRMRQGGPQEFLLPESKARPALKFFNFFGGVLRFFHVFPQLD